MTLPTDIRPVSATLYYLPITMRVPLKFGPETVTCVDCARVKMTVTDRQGRRADGWGETPLAVQWGWPSSLPYQQRLDTMKAFCGKLAEAWSTLTMLGHPIEVGYDFQQQVFHKLLDNFNRQLAGDPLPYLAALICCSAFDIALHDAYGMLHNVDIYTTYNRRYMSRDLSQFLEPADGANIHFAGQFPDRYLVEQPPARLPAWHLVGGLDPLEPADLTGQEPRDGYPVLLPDWIETDQLKCLKIKLRGIDEPWDYQRIVRIGDIAVKYDVPWLSADFNCTVTDPDYVNRILDRLRDEHPRLYGMLLYVEQPFPYDLEANPLDVRSVSARKPLFLDESAHDWQAVRLGRARGWAGVALKTCKTQTGALLSLCWAKAHGMPLMVQDLTNPMLAVLPHLRLAAYAGTIMGVETNGPQFSPEASKPEAAVHPGCYRRREGCVDLSTIGGPGFGYRLERIKRELPKASEPAA